MGDERDEFPGCLKLPTPEQLPAAIEVATKQLGQTLREQRDAAIADRDALRALVRELCEAFEREIACGIKNCVVCPPKHALLARARKAVEG